MPELKPDDQDNYLAYFKFYGLLVADGYLDARKASEALLGIDEVMRYFIIQTDQLLAQTDFEIPIMVRKGSWEAIIPHSISEWLTTAAGAGLVAYATKAVGKIAENDFKEISSKDIAKGAIKSIKWVLRIGKHMGSLAVRKFKNVKFDESDTNGIPMVGIENSNGDVLYVPQEYLEIYRSCPEKLFDKIIKNVAEERAFEVGLNPNEPLDKDDTVTSVTVDVSEKHIFVGEVKEEVILFPELIHGNYVELEGHVSRGNENSNTIGFEYSGHVLTCSPTITNVKAIKSLLFTNCRIKGYVDRLGPYSNGMEKRPHIKFNSLEALPQAGTQLPMFN